VQVLLVHPGGPYWTHKHAGAWSIPKGEVEPYELDDGEDGRLAAARREFREETGFDPHDLAGPGGRYLPLGGVKQRGHKIVYAWALEGDCDPSLIVSEQLEMEWPPRSGRTITIPEVDRAEWFDLGAAREAINPGQRRFLDELEALLDVPAEAR
jgi:predicted NUDIX family NTP pyrophosphohydrolase